MWLIHAALRRPITILVAVIAAALTAGFGVSRMRVLSAPKQMQGLSGFDLEVVEYVHG